jgi:RNA polymerase sigma factor (sigma-70 family)
MESRIQEKSVTIVEALKMNSNRVFNDIYHNCFPSINYMILSNSGTSHDAEDVFQDAMMLIIQKARNNELKLTCSIKTYLYAVCHNMWQSQLGRKSKEVHFSGNIEIADDPDPDQRLFEDRLYEIYRLNFARLSKKNQKILNMFLSRFPMTMITQEMGYKNEKYAKVKKYLCKEQLRKNILKDQQYKELICIYSN